MLLIIESSGENLPDSSVWTFSAWLQIKDQLVSNIKLVSIIGTDPAEHLHKLV